MHKKGHACKYYYNGRNATGCIEKRFEIIENRKMRGRWRRETGVIYDELDQVGYDNPD